MNWIETKGCRPPKGRIAIWFDDDIVSARVLDRGIVDCPVLQLTWDLERDPEHKWFTHWQLVTAPLTAEQQQQKAGLDELVGLGQAMGDYDGQPEPPCGR